MIIVTTTLLRRLARKGETMATAAVVAYAYDQIDQARAELSAVSRNRGDTSLSNSVP
jgi:hypothetical protein